MAASQKATGIDRVFDLISRIWKVILMIAIIGGVVISISRTWDKIDRNEKEWKAIDDKYNSMIKEMIKDNKAQLDDQHELIIKTMQSQRELKDRMNEHEISAAEFRGRVKAMLKIQ